MNTTATGLSVSVVAQVAHEANRAFCVTLGDDSQPSWADAPDWQRESALKGVQAHLEAHAAGSPLTPRESHEAWLAEKAANGWTYGRVKDAEAKTHPCFVPYSELPQAQRVKDYLFAAVVRAFVEASKA